MDVFGDQKNRVFKGFFLLLFFYSFQASALTTQDFRSLWSGQALLQNTPEDGDFVRLETAPEEGPSYFSTSPTTPIDFSKKYVRFKIRINNLESWGGIEARFSTDPEHNFQNYYALNIPFYSDSEFNILQPGHWAELTLAMGEAKKVGNPDIRKIRHIGFFVAGKEGAPAFVVDFKDLKIEESMTDAVISLTFDDNYDDHYEAAKIMAQYRLRGTAYVMTNEIGADSYMTSAQVVELKERFGWSVSTHHKIPITALGAELDAEMQNNFYVLEELGLPAEEARHFAYPLGKQSREKTLPYIREHFATARVAGGGAETLPPSDWHMLRTFNVTPKTTPEMIAARIEEAKLHGEWLILMFHFFTDGEPADDLTYNYADFAKLCELIDESGVRVHTVDEVYEAFQ